jgi:hypothetical protein
LFKKLPRNAAVRVTLADGSRAATHDDARELGHLVSVRGAPRYLRSDKGHEFIARAILRWMQTA